jgi:hypothetical protein
VSRRACEKKVIVLGSPGRTAFQKMAATKLLFCCFDSTRLRRVIAKTTFLCSRLKRRWVRPGGSNQEKWAW